VVVPPLRERGPDVLLLFRHFLAQFSDALSAKMPPIDPAAEALLAAYSWPGNVRELRNVAERVAVRHTDGAVTPRDLPQEIRYPLGRTSFDKVPGSDQPRPAVVFPAADAAWDRMMRGGKSFWSVVHPLFINRELTKADVREIIRKGLVETGGSYRKLVALFHLPDADYKRFLAFLSQHECHLPFHEFRGRK